MLALFRRDFFVMLGPTMKMIDEKKLQWDPSDNSVGYPDGESSVARLRKVRRALGDLAALM
jgi:hypothetical protein